MEHRAALPVHVDITDRFGERQDETTSDHISVVIDLD